MKEVKFTTPCSSAFVLPEEILSELPSCGANELKVYIYLSAKHELDYTSAASFLGITSSEFESAVEFWKQKGLLSTGEVKPSAAKNSSLLQDYDSQTISSAIESEPEFACLKDHIADVVGKILNKNDIGLLYNLYHLYGMSVEYICLIAAYASGNGKASLPYIVKTAVAFYDDGADTYEKLEKAINERRKYENIKVRFAGMCGFGSRKLTSKEQQFITRWFDEFEMEFELVQAGYECMIDTIHKVSLPYLDKILTEWNGLGIKTASEAAAQSEKFKSERSAESHEDDSFDVSEFIEAAKKKGVN